MVIVSSAWAGLVRGFGYGAAAGMATYVLVGAGAGLKATLDGEADAAAFFGGLVIGAMYLPLPALIGGVIGGVCGLVLGALIGLVAAFSVTDLAWIAAVIGIVGNLAIATHIGANTYLGWDWGWAFLVYAPLFGWTCYRHGASVAAWVAKRPRWEARVPIGAGRVGSR